MNSKFPPISCYIFSLHIPRNSTRRKICGTRFGRKSSRTTLSNLWKTSTQSSKRPPSTSNAIRPSSNPSPRPPTSQSQSDMEAVLHEPLPDRIAELLSQLHQQLRQLDKDADST